MPASIINAQAWRGTHYLFPLQHSFCLRSFYSSVLHPPVESKPIGDIPRSPSHQRRFLSGALFCGFHDLLAQTIHDGLLTADAKKCALFVGTLPQHFTARKDFAAQLLC